MPENDPPEDIPENEVFSTLMVNISERRDQVSFSRIFDHFAPRVRSYMLQLGATPNVADDLVQDVMLTVWRRADQFDPLKAGLGTWIFTIARNRRIDLIRKDRRPELDPNDPALVQSDEPGADVVLQRKQSGVVIQEALAGLPENQSEMLRLAYFEDLSHGDIARQLSLPLGTVKSRIRLATDKLRTKLMELY